MPKTSSDEFGIIYHSSKPPFLHAYAAISSAQPNEKGPSTHLTGDIGPEQARTDAQKLQSCKRHIFGTLVDIFCLSLCISILVFAGFARNNDGVAIDTHQRRLLQISRIATTLFPYLFGVIVGRGIKSILNWRCAMGINIVSFTYLSKCMTLASALITPLSLRIIHWVPPVLISIWVFSPLGSQGMLRSISELQAVQETNSTVLYYYPATSGLTRGANNLVGVNSANAVLFASLLSVGTTLNHSMDNFGNIKIPTLTLSNGYSGASEWTNMAASGWATYSSLIGVPFVKPITEGNSTFRMRSWYWHLSDPVVSLYISGKESFPDGISYPWLPPAEEGWKNFTSKSRFWQFLSPNSTDFSNSSASLAVPIIFESANPDSPAATSLNQDAYEHAGITRLSGKFTHHPVEMQVFCNKDSCNTTAVRPSELFEPYPFEADFSFFTRWFLQYLSQAFPITHGGTPTPDAFNVFLNDSSIDPFSKNVGNLPDLASLGATELASRLEHIINAYWITHSALGGVISLNNVNLTMYSDLAEPNIPPFANASATLLEWKTILKCDDRWLTILYLATVVMTSAAAASLVFNLLYSGPEVCDFTSALMRSYRMPDVQRGTLSGDELVREMKNVTIKVGDVSAEDGVGRIVIGPRELVGNLDGKRFYV